MVYCNHFTRVYYEPRVWVMIGHELGRAMKQIIFSEHENCGYQTRFLLVKMLLSGNNMFTITVINIY